MDLRSQCDLECESSDVRATKEIVYETAAQFDAIIKARETDATLLPNGRAREAVLVEVALLRSYARLQDRLTRLACGDRA